jgi:chromosome segregation protein
LNLKTIEISGFKSFLNPLRLDFTGGITAVIGPNGCGKTNIVDGIRWVLGEQKTRMLRNTKMENVIFNGTKLRKPLGMAEVHMTLSNADRTFPLDYEEITISRKLFRTGESEYYINGELGRLRDIKGLLVDSGLGSHAYSIIEREMVDSVISDKDDDKRFLLEEAAGVMRYRFQREEALRKVKQTEADLVRLSDILAELDRELRSLRYQVGKADRYSRLKEKVGQMEAVLVKRSLFELLEKRDQVEADKTRHENITLADENEIRLRESRLQESRIQGAELERRLQDLYENRHGISLLLQQREERIAILLERITGGKHRIDEDDEEIKRAVTKLASMGEETPRHREAVARKEADFAAAQVELIAKDQDLSRVAGELGTLRDRLRDKKQLALDLAREKGRQRGFRDHLETRVQELEEKRHADEALRTTLEADGRTIGRRLSERVSDIERHRARIRDLDRSREEAYRKSEKIVGLLSACQAVDSKASIALNGAGEKKEYLERIRHEHGNGRGRLAEDRRVKGVLADHIKVDKRYRKAFEACLSPVLQGLITESETDALDCLRQARANGGRLQLLYPNGNGAKRRFFQHRKVLGTALDFVKAGVTAAGYLERRLAEVAIVADVETAIELVREDSTIQVATLDGVYFDGRGRIIVGDSDDIQITLLEYESKLTELAEDIRRQQRRIATVGRRKESLAVARASLLERVAIEKERMASEETELNRLGEEQRRDEIERTKITEKLALVNGALVEDARTLDEIRTSLATFPVPDEGERPADEDLTAVETRVATLEGEKDRLAEQAALRRLQAATTGGEIATAKEKLSNLELLERELGELIRLREEDAKRCHDEIAVAEREIQSSKGEIAQYHAQVAHIEKDIEAAKTERDVATEGTAVLEKGLKDLKAQSDEKKDNLQRCSLELATIDTRISGVLERAQENFDQDLTGFVSDRSLFSPSEWETFNDELLATLRSKLESIGPVNMLALQEFEEKKTRFDFLMKQKQDLDEAKESLLQAIRRINREARQRLSETFEMVRANFKKCFLTLFDGGEADLMFVDSDDPLEANIKLVANPKGKKLHDISSLSGGERALVALSLLFAIYLVKPSPFCVFDEVDAPLDDSNIGRFVNMLRSFTDRIQFIVITHNKRTMEAANHLYGVTMQEPGVSRMISVHIGEVDRFREKTPSIEKRPARVPEPVPTPDEVPVQT